MKKYILLFVAITFTSFSYGQNIEEVMNRYSDGEQFSKMSLTSDILRMFAQDYDQRKIIDKIDKVDVYLFNDGITLEKEDVRDLKSSLKSDSFEQLINVRDKDLKVDIFVKDNDDRIKRLFMILLTGGEKQIVARIKCDLSYEDFKDLELSFEGAENLKLLGKQM